MTFKKGESGNAKGRPLKNRALTDILEKAGSTKKVYGQDIAPKRIVAELLWQAAATGEVTFPGDTDATPLDIEDWFGVVKFIYQHIDGPPKSEMDVDGKILLAVTYGDDGTGVPVSNGTNNPAA